LHHCNHRQRKTPQRTKRERINKPKNNTSNLKELPTNNAKIADNSQDDKKPKSGLNKTKQKLMQKERKLSAKTTKIIQRITVMIKAQLNKDNQNTKIKTQIKTLINTIKSEVITEIKTLVTDIKNLTLNLMP